MNPAKSRRPKGTSFGRGRHGANDSHGMSHRRAVALMVLATLVRVSATMKLVYIVAQHRPENQITRLPARMSRHSAAPRRGTSSTSNVSALNRLRQKVTSKLRAASRWRVTTPAMLQNRVTTTIRATAREWVMDKGSPSRD